MTRDMLNQLMQGTFYDMVTKVGFEKVIFVSDYGRFSYHMQASSDLVKARKSVQEDFGKYDLLQPLKLGRAPDDEKPLSGDIAKGVDVSKFKCTAANYLKKHYEKFYFYHWGQLRKSFYGYRLRVQFAANEIGIITANDAVFTFDPNGKITSYKAYKDSEP